MPTVTQVGPKYQTTLTKAELDYLTALDRWNKALQNNGAQGIQRPADCTDFSYNTPVAPKKRGFLRTVFYPFTGVRPFLKTLVAAALVVGAVYTGRHYGVGTKLMSMMPASFQPAFESAVRTVRSYTSGLDLSQVRSQASQWLTKLRQVAMGA